MDFIIGRLCLGVLAIMTWIAASAPACARPEADLALTVACRRGDLAAAERALQLGAAPGAWTPLPKDGESRTALMVACYQGYPEIARLLIERGAPIAVKTPTGFSALTLA